MFWGAHFKLGKVEDLRRIILCYKENKHIVKRLEAIEETLRVVYGWSEEEIEKNRSKDCVIDELKDHFYWAHQFHDLYEYIALRLKDIKNYSWDEEKILKECLIEIKICLKIVPKIDK